MGYPPVSLTTQVVASPSYPQASYTMAHLSYYLAYMASEVVASTSYPMEDASLQAMSSLFYSPVSYATQVTASVGYTPVEQDVIMEPTPLEASSLPLPDPEFRRPAPPQGNKHLQPLAPQQSAPLRQAHPTYQAQQAQPQTPYEQQVLAPKMYSEAARQGPPQGGSLSSRGRGLLALQGQNPPQVGQQATSTSGGQHRSWDRTPGQQTAHGGRKSNQEYQGNPYTHRVPQDPTQYPNSSWQHLVGHILDYFLYLAFPRLPYLERCYVVVDSIDLMEGCKNEWYFLKEEDPLKFMEYLSGAIDRMSGCQVGAITGYTKWIKEGTYYHASILKREQLNFCPHSQSAHLPSPNVRCLSDAALDTNDRDFSKARKDTTLPQVEFRKVQDWLMEALKLHQKHDRATSIASIKRQDGGSSRASTLQVSSSQAGTTQVSSSSGRPSVAFDPAEPMLMDVDGSATATGGRGDADSSWEVQMDRQDWQEQLNEARGQGPHPSRPRRWDTSEWQEPHRSSKWRRETSTSGGRAGQSLYPFPLVSQDER